jgi:hypothetical protein
MKNLNSEYQNPFLNKINHIIPQINNLAPVILPKTNNHINGPSVESGPFSLVREKLIRHNPAATSE